MPIKKKNPNGFYIFGIKIEKFILIDFDRSSNVLWKYMLYLIINKVNCRKRNNQKEKNFWKKDKSSPRFKTTLITICRANNILEADGKVFENQIDFHIWCINKKLWFMQCKTHYSVNYSIYYCQPFVKE